MHIEQKAEEQLIILHRMEYVTPQNSHEELSLQELDSFNAVIRK